MTSPAPRRAPAGPRDLRQSGASILSVYRTAGRLVRLVNAARHGMPSRNTPAAPRCHVRVRLRVILTGWRSVSDVVDLLGRPGAPNPPPRLTHTRKAPHGAGNPPSP